MYSQILCTRVAAKGSKMQIKVANFLRNRIHVYLSRCSVSSFNYSNCIDISPEVSKALKSHDPVVALESTIISHGMPYPQNLQTALQVEEVIRKQVYVYRLSFGG